MPVWTASLAAAAIAGAPGCGGAARAIVDPEPLVVREVMWNPGRADVGRVAAVADGGSEVLVVGDRGAFVFVDGSVTGADRRAIAWRGAAPIPAADGKGTWLAAIDDRGAVFRVRGRTSLEAISDRYGLFGTPVLAVAPMGRGFLGFALGSGRIAVADGREVVTLAGGAATGEWLSAKPANEGSRSFTGGGGEAAWIDGDEIRVLDPSTRATRSFALPGVRRIALDERGAVWAVTNHCLYTEDPTGALVLVHETDDPRSTISGLSISGERAWFSVGAEVATLAVPRDPRRSLPVAMRRLQITRGRRAPVATALIGSPSGDVWTLADGALSRISAAPPGERARWTATLAPIHARSCASCHGPAGSPGVDLSTLDAWESRRSAVRRRVIESRDMPPRGHPLSDEDRKAIDDWTAPRAR